MLLSKEFVPCMRILLCQSLSMILFCMIWLSIQMVIMHPTKPDILNISASIPDRPAASPALLHPSITQLTVYLSNSCSHYYSLKEFVLLSLVWGIWWRNHFLLPLEHHVSLLQHFNNLTRVTFHCAYIYVYSCSPKVLESMVRKLFGCSFITVWQYLHLWRIKKMCCSLPAINKFISNHICPFM